MHWNYNGFFFQFLFLCYSQLISFDCAFPDVYVNFFFLCTQSYNVSNEKNDDERITTTYSIFTVVISMFAINDEPLYLSYLIFLTNWFFFCLA